MVLAQAGLLTGYSERRASCHKKIVSVKHANGSLVGTESFRFRSKRFKDKDRLD